MIRINKEMQQSYINYLKDHFINGEFIFDEDLSIDEVNEELSDIISTFRTNSYTVTEAMLALVDIAYCYINDNSYSGYKNPIERKALDYLKKLSPIDINSLLQLLSASCYKGYQDILEYELDEEEEQKYLWRY